MSKKAKAAAKDKRKKLKAGRKATQRAQYETWKKEGTNKKSKRNRLASRRAGGIRTKRHPQSFCGNVGCMRCFPELNHSAFASTRSPAYRKKFMPRAKY